MTVLKQAQISKKGRDVGLKATAIFSPIALFAQLQTWNKIPGVATIPQRLVRVTGTALTTHIRSSQGSRV
ncbi:hypothetical protein GCM10007385_43940 [Tateyamaria omphalii]|nr:hypothetical protein GCM10007385_43940 [Tateyamaria omphalii]